VTEVSGDFNDILKERSPTDLKDHEWKTLLDLGATEKEAAKFLDNNAFSPSAQTAFVLNLRSMKGVANRRLSSGWLGKPARLRPTQSFASKPPRS